MAKRFCYVNLKWINDNALFCLDENGVAEGGGQKKTATLTLKERGRKEISLKRYFLDWT